MREMHYRMPRCYIEEAPAESMKNTWEKLDVIEQRGGVQGDVREYGEGGGVPHS